MVNAAGRSEVTGHLSPVTHAIAVALASLAFNIRGFCQIKLKNYRAVKTREAARSCASCAVRRRRYSRQRGSEALDVRCRRDIVPHDDFSPAVEFAFGGGRLAFRPGLDQGTHPAVARKKPVSEQSLFANRVLAC